MKLSLLRIAKNMGMNVARLEEVTGYSRQGLHQILNKENGINARRWNTVIRALESAIDNEYELQKTRLKEEHRKHRQAITEFNLLIEQK